MVAIRRALASLVAASAASAAMAGLFAGPARAQSSTNGTETIAVGPWVDQPTCLSAESLYKNSVPYVLLGCSFQNIPGQAGWYYEVKIAVPGQPLPPPPPH